MMGSTVGGIFLYFAFFSNRIGECTGNQRKIDRLKRRCTVCGRWCTGTGNQRTKKDHKGDVPLWSVRCILFTNTTVRSLYEYTLYCRNEECLLVSWWFSQYILSIMHLFKSFFLWEARSPRWSENKRRY